MRCLDIGCGGGAVTRAVAGLVAPGGTVVGIDTDEVKLGLARQAAADSVKRVLRLHHPSAGGGGA
jgi:precorrin-6B methylase 2